MENSFNTNQSQTKPILTTREAEIINHIAKGRTNRQIANTLFISEETVKVHVKNMFAKLGVNNRVLALCKAGVF